MLSFGCGTANRAVAKTMAETDEKVAATRTGRKQALAS